jgi:diadenosine tetraphosphate (Ap4A) HIT family hydrolase
MDAVSAWNDPSSWAALIDGSGCPVCQRGEPLNVVASLQASWVTMQEIAPLRGYACLVSKTHVVELHELDRDTLQSFVLDAQRLSAAVAAVTGAIKLNYEIHGNTIPHLHMHLYPRYRGDAFEDKPIDARNISEFAAIRDEVVRVLGARAV